MTVSVGLIGLGNMGGAISTNLVKAGHQVFGFDTDTSACRRGRDNGVEIMQDCHEVIRHCPITITSLPNPDALHQICAQLAKHQWQDKILIESGTFSVEDKIAAARVLEESGITILDCPLSGTGHQARSGDLVVFASGDQAAVDRCTAVFQGFSRDQKYCGEFGNGSRMKFVANHLIAVHNVAAAEAMVLGMKAKLDPHLIYDVIKDSAGTSRMFQVRAALMADDNYDDVGATNTLFSKDLDVIGDFAARVNCPVPLFALATQPYRALMGTDLEKKDTAAVCRVLERSAGLERK